MGCIVDSIAVGEVGEVLEEDRVFPAARDGGVFEVAIFNCFCGGIV